MKAIFYAVIMALASVEAMAQSITGKVVDESNLPMEFVNVVLQKADSTYITGTVTDGTGTFLFGEEHVDAKLIRLSSVGYADQTIGIPATGNMGVITMKAKDVMLGEVVVKSKRPLTTVKGDALVTTVVGSQFEHAGTANDVLAQVPMVLGRDGNFEVFGKGSPAIYINGREVMDITQLSQLSSADIKNIEVITNPGARYGAAVKSVIRIKTKRPQGDGFSGNIRAQGVVQKYFRTVDHANFKYRTGGLEVFGNFGYIGGKFEGGN